jgi:hypothetical protein
MELRSFVRVSRSSPWVQYDPYSFTRMHMLAKSRQSVIGLVEVNLLAAFVEAALIYQQRLDASNMIQSVLLIA